MALQRLKELNTKECLWVYVLKVLSERQGHPYPIRKEIETRYGFRPGYMTVYKVFYLLEKEGLLRKKREGSRTVYTVTTKGKEELAAAGEFYRTMVRVAGG